MQIIESYLTNNPCYKTNRKIEVKGLMLHSVGCNQPKASVFVKNWDTPTQDNVCVHAFIDGLTGDVYQTLPWSHRGWHGGGSSNNTHIGVEMCEPATIQYLGNGAAFHVLDYDNAVEVTKRVYESAVELFAFLCEKYSLDPLKQGVICSHSEGHKMGIASNHADPEHLWRQLSLPYTMDGFRQDVAGTINKSDPSKSDVIYRVQVGAFKVKQNAINFKNELKKLGYDCFIVEHKEV